MEPYRLRFIDKILDNVHGFIEFTAVEKDIIQLPVFKRLQGIKQLGLTNWIFPGAEHTRFIHTLGVMYVADQMALQLNYSDEERQLVRLAGLLHDIGHYPLSHVGERAYKDAGSRRGDPLLDNRRHVEKTLESLMEETSVFMKPAGNPCHHEQVTGQVIENDRDIKAILERYCGGSRLITLDNICDIITGNVERNPEISGLVQLIHSELDADRIDYVMRDATFSGTSYGNFELGLLLRNLARTRYQGVEIIGVHPKGIAIADQFLMNRFYSYTQVFFNRHVAILEFMSQVLSQAFLEREDSEYPSVEGLRQAVINHCDGTEYLYFTDRAFWDSLHHVSLPAGSCEAEFQKRLLKYQELEISENREISVNGRDAETILSQITSHPIYQNLKAGRQDRIPVVFVERFTRQLPWREFEKHLDPGDEERLKLRRLQEGITILEEGKEPVVLCDSPASLMSQLYPMRSCILREYRYGKD